MDEEESLLSTIAVVVVTPAIFFCGGNEDACHV